MGWTRNYHNYYYCDLFDGAIWCPMEHGSNKCIYFQIRHGGKTRHGGDDFDPRQTFIGELLRKVGNKVAWVHDFGDNFSYIIELDDIVKSTSQVDGRCVILEGAMRFPPEDYGRCSKYQEEILNLHFKSKEYPYDDELQRQRGKMFFDVRKSINVLGRFDPEAFNLTETQQIVNDALRSRNSSLTGSKVFCDRYNYMVCCLHGQRGIYQKFLMIIGDIGTHV